jgi:hypothetical protein
MQHGLCSWLCGILRNGFTVSIHVIRVIENKTIQRRSEGDNLQKTMTTSKINYKILMD